MIAHRVPADRADKTYVVPSRAEPARHVGRTPPDAPSQCPGIDVVTWRGDALDSQDYIRRYHAEHEDFSHAR